MTIFLCFFVGFIFLSLPFWPSILEVFRPSDSKALKITQHILRDPRSSPEFLYWHFAHLLGAESLDALETLARVKEPTLLPNGILAVPGGNIETVPNTVGRLLSSDSIKLAENTTYLSKIVSLRSIETGSKNAINEIHAKEQLIIGPKSKIMWWASGGDITLKNKLELTGKIQAAQSIHVDGSIQFHHLEAPLISTASSKDRAALKTLMPQFVALPQSPPRHHYTENCELKPGEVIDGDLIVKGELTLGEGSRVHGSVKCHRKVVLKEGSYITGNLVGLADISCEGKNWIGGSVLGQKRIRFDNSVFIGSENQRVTLSADRIEIKGAFQAHGTLRAWTLGTVKSS